MIGIVVVSHSPALAEAAVALALEMVPGEKPPIAIAAGAGEGITGTDAARVAAAIDEVSGPEGVLVFMDLGSALMSTELALEFVSDPDVPVKLTSAPFVEGLLAGIVTAAGGAGLDDVEREARGALAAKATQLGDDAPDAAPAEPEAPAVPDAAAADAAAADAVAADAVTADLELINPSGLHARPASLVAAAALATTATVTVANLHTGAPAVRGDSSIALMTLGARTGDSIRVSATGPGAREAVSQISALVADGFGEL